MSDLVKSWLSSYIGGHDPTDPVILCQNFYRAALPQSKSVNHGYVFIPREVYDLCWNVYDKAVQLHHDLIVVLMNEDHQDILAEAEALGYQLPDLNAFHEEMEVFRNAVSRFSPYKVSEGGNGYVRVPVQTARALNDLMKYNCFMLARIFDDCFNTEYMRQFKFYKDSGYAYDGPNALQSSLDLIAAMRKMTKEMDRQIAKGRQQEDWHHLIAERL